MKKILFALLLISFATLTSFTHNPERITKLDTKNLCGPGFTLENNSSGGTIAAYDFYSNGSLADQETSLNLTPGNTHAMNGGVQFSAPNFQLVLYFSSTFSGKVRVRNSIGEILACQTIKLKTSVTFNFTVANCDYNIIEIADFFCGTDALK